MLYLGASAPSPPPSEPPSWRQGGCGVAAAVPSRHASIRPSNRAPTNRLDNELDGSAAFEPPPPGMGFGIVDRRPERRAQRLLELGEPALGDVVFGRRVPAKGAGPVEVWRRTDQEGGQRVEA